jgi:enterochelin esterase-like enzyme
MVALVAFAVLARQGSVSFSVSFPKEIMGQFSGKVYLFVTKRTDVEPRLADTWLSPTPVFVASVKGMKADTPFVLNDENATGWPLKPSALASGDYQVQAVIERNAAANTIAQGDGNLYSNPATLHVAGGSGSATLACTETIEEPDVHRTATTDVIEYEAIKGGTFRVAAVYPTGYGPNSKVSYPVIIDIPDLNGTFADIPGRGTNAAAYRDGKPFIYLRVDTSSPTGSNELVDGVSTGAWGTNLVKEFIPYLAKEYHADPNRVYLLGHGSGAWSTLWLQLKFPGAFQGAYAISPESVDFHSFRGLDLYATNNIYRDDTGAARSAVRGPAAAEPTWQEVAESESPLRVGWLASWEAIFSPRSKKGKPLPLFDRVTGQVDPVAFKAWQKYDLDAEAAAMAPDQLQLARPKLHIFVGDADAYQRDRSVRLMSQAMPGLDVHFLPGDQDAIQTPALDAEISKSIRIAAYGAG